MSRADQPVESEAGDRGRRFELLYNAHAERVLAFAMRRVPTDDAGEIMAETFLVAWRRLNEMPAEPLPWLLVVARNIILNQQRSLRRRRALGVRLEADLMRQTTSVEDPADEVGTRQAILAALQRLPAMEREALILSAWDRVEHREAAQIAGCTPGTFAVRLHRARKRLAKELQGIGDPSIELSVHMPTEEASDR